MIKNRIVIAMATTLLTLLIISSAYALVPITNAQLVPNPTTKGLTLINQVAGFNLTRYNATSTLNDASTYMGFLPQENIRYTLTGPNGVVQIQDTFTNGSLQIMDVLENAHSYQLPAGLTTPPLGFSKSDAQVDIAKTFLLNYQSYSANQFYGQLASTLNGVDATQNSTITFGDTKLTINATSGNSAIDNSTTFTWSYTINGVDADCKCVSLSYQNGFLKSFIDTWNLYPIGSTTVSISSRQAEDTAMQNARTHTWAIGSGNEKYTINNFNITKPVVERLQFCPAGNTPNARNSDPLTLYPMWSIGVGLDKFYPGDVYGIDVDIWADTGQVISTQELFSTLPPPAGSAVATLAQSSIPTANGQPPTTLSSITTNFTLLLTVPFVITLAFVSLWLTRKKAFTFSLRPMKNQRISGVVLSILIASTLAMAITSAVPAVNAASAVTWGNDSDGSGGTLYHTPNEIGNQTMIATYVNSLFQSSGYAYCNNMQGVATIPQNVQSYVPYADEYGPSATLWFDHGVGMTGIISGYPNEFHYMVCGTSAIDKNPSGDIFDYQIYGYTSSQKNDFTYISTCLSGDLKDPSSLDSSYTGGYGLNNQAGNSGNPIGMPFAWTHGASMSNDAYSYPDEKAYCYIGFPWGSASLSQQSLAAIDPNYPTITYGNFISDFFYGALTLHDSVNQALDYASYTCWSHCYGASTLYSGFSALWPKNSTDPGTLQPDCTMAIYGNGNMYLYAGSPDYVSIPSIADNVPSIGQTNTNYQFSASATDPCGYGLTYTFNYGDGSAPTTQTTHSYSSQGLYTVTVTATSSTGISRQSSTTISIGCILTLSAYDGYNGMPLYPGISVDGNPVGTTTTSIPVLPGYHTITFSAQVWNPGWNTFSTFCNMDDSNGQYSNGASVNIQTSDNLYAIYWP